MYLIVDFLRFPGLSGGIEYRLDIRFGEAIADLSWRNVSLGFGLVG